MLEFVQGRRMFAGTRSIDSGRLLGIFFDERSPFGQVFQVAGEKVFWAVDT